LAFLPSRARAVSRPFTRLVPIAVGQHVFVNCPESRSGSVQLGDMSGKVLSAERLDDGAEVEVVAWRPIGVSAARYRIRARSGGVDGWLAAEHLRTAFIPVPKVAAPPPGGTSFVAPAERRFGQRAHAERTYAPVEPTYAPAAPVVSDPVPGGGRRFGHHFESEAAPGGDLPPVTPPTSPVNPGGRRFGQRS